MLRISGLGTGVRGICVLGALLWSGVASAQVVPTPIPGCDAALDRAPTQRLAPAARGGSGVALQGASTIETPDGMMEIASAPERVVEVWESPTTSGSVAACGPAAPSTLFTDTGAGPRVERDG